MIEFIQTNLTLILSVGWALSEALALIPVVKANSVFQLVVGILAGLKKALLPAPKA